MKNLKSKPYEGAQKLFFESKQERGLIIGGSPSRVDINQIAFMAKLHEDFEESAEGWETKQAKIVQFPRRTRKRFQPTRKKVGKDDN